MSDVEKIQSLYLEFRKLVIGSGASQDDLIATKGMNQEEAAAHISTIAKTKADRVEKRMATIKAVATRVIGRELSAAWFTRLRTRSDCQRVDELCKKYGIGGFNNDPATWFHHNQSVVSLPMKHQ